MLDQIGTAHMTQGSSAFFTTDRFGCPNSALALNGGWTQVLSGIYFDTLEFTISVWVYPQQLSNGARVIDFGNGQSLDNIFLAISQLFSSPNFQIYNGTTRVVPLYGPSSKRFALCQWQLLTVTFNSKINSSIIYINGQSIASSNKNYNPPNINRTKCYIGKSNWASDGYSWSYLDDLRFYNKCLNQSEILILVNNSSEYIYFYF